MNQQGTHPRYANFADCMNRAGMLWQSAAGLEHALETLQAFQALRDLLPPGERSAYETVVRTTAWLFQAENTTDDVSAIRFLDSPEQAQAVLACCRQKELRLSVGQLSPEVAAVLASHEGELSLPGMTRLDTEVAHALAQRPRGRKMLTLGIGLGDIDSFALLEPLWSRPDAYINLPAITRLDDQAAEVLGRVRGTLCLPNLNALSTTQARFLVQGNIIKLEADGLGDRALTVELAQALCSGQLNELSVNGITQAAAGLPKLAAHAWSMLQLDGVTQLSATLAQTLCRAGLLTLRLNGLTALDAATARVLCGTARNFGLYLNGLTSLDDAVAAVLVGNSNSLLEIRRVCQLSGAARQMMRAQGNVESDLLD